MRSYFKSLSDGTEYAVDILDNTSDEVTLSGNEPFVVTYDNNGNLYAPARYSGATINIVTNEFLWRLYASTPQELKVKLRSGNNTLWVGYITPTMYNQSYVHEYETLQIDCVDGLSTLRYIPYTAITKLVANKHPNHVWSFWEILVHCIAKCDCYNHIYISNSISLYDVREYTSNAWQYIEDEDALKSLYISESLFWDADEKKYTTCDQVLEAICRYLSLTMVAYGDAVYFINYYGIGAFNVYGRRFHHYYNIDATNLTATHELSTLSDSRMLTGSAYRGASNISLDTIYSKVSVKPQLNIIDKLFNDYDDEDKRTMIQLDITEPTVDVDVQILDLQGVTGRYWGLLQMYNIENWTVYNYPQGWEPGDVPVTIETPTKYIELSQSVGATLVREMVAEKKKGLAWDIQNLAFNDYLLFRCKDEWYGDYTKPYAEIALDDKAHAVLAAGEEGYLVISGSVYLSCSQDIYFIPLGSQSTGQKNMSCSLMARLQMWDHYWNGSTWVTTPCDFEIPLDIEGDTPMFNSWFDINNTITWLTYRDQLNATGYGIPLPFSRQSVEGQGLGIKNVSVASYNVNAKLTLYPPKRPNGLTTKLSAVFIKGLKCEIKTRTPYTEEVEYTKVNNSSFIEEFNDDDMLINTYDKRNQSLSFVSALARESESSSTERRLVKEIIDNSANIHGAGEQVRVEKIAKQHSSPRIVLQCTLFNNVKPYTRYKSTNLGGKIFVVDSQTIDYLNGSTSVKLVEVGTE